jgi:hypothetical protein
VVFQSQVFHHDFGSTATRERTIGDENVQRGVLLRCNAIPETFSDFGFTEAKASRTCRQSANRK